MALVPINEIAFQAASQVLYTEYEKNPTLLSAGMVNRVTKPGAQSYKWYFQEKVDFTDVSPGSPLTRQRPSVRQLTVSANARSVRLSSDLFTQAEIQPSEIQNFTRIINEALVRDHNQMLFDAVDDVESSLPVAQVMGTEDAPVTFDTDLLIKINKIFANEATPGTIFVIGANEMATLMSDDKFQSFFYNASKPLVGGTIVPFMGYQFYIVPSYPSQTQISQGKLTSFTGDEGTGNKIFAMSPDAFGAFFNMNPTMKAWFDNDSVSWQYDCYYQANVTNLRTNGVIIIYSAPQA